MRKISFFTLALLVSIGFTANAQQTVIDISSIDAAYTTTFDDELVIDVATTSSAVASPSLSYENPLKELSFEEAEISFDVYNYHGTDSIKVLGALLAFFDADLGRMYFSNGSYLGFNAMGSWFDANLIDYGIGTDFIEGNRWTNVKLQFTKTGYAMYYDDMLAFNESSSTVTITTGQGGEAPNYENVISFLKQASIFVIGTGSWWSDNTRGDGTYWDAQFSYLKNIKLTPDFSSLVSSVDMNISSTKGELVREEYFNVAGMMVGTKFSSLEPGLYIRRAFYSNGVIESTKTYKLQR